MSLQQRIRELENALLDKGRKLTDAEETIARLESKSANSRSAFATTAAFDAAKSRDDG